MCTRETNSEDNSEMMIDIIDDDDDDHDGVEEVKIKSVSVSL